VPAGVRACSVVRAAGLSVEHRRVDDGGARQEVGPSAERESRTGGAGTPHVTRRRRAGELSRQNLSDREARPPILDAAAAVMDGQSDEASAERHNFSGPRAFAGRPFCLPHRAAERSRGSHRPAPTGRCPEAAELV
jgi:hypothetical protein